MTTENLWAAETETDVLTTELNSLATLASPSAGMSTVGGVINVSRKTHAWFEFLSGGSITPAAGGYLAGWILNSVDAGANYENTPTVVSGAVQGRPPDFYIYLPNVAGTQRIGTGQQPILLPPGSFKFVLLNAAGVALSSSGNKLRMQTSNIENG